MNASMIGETQSGAKMSHPRELADRTLEAYRKLNEAAAAARYRGNGKTADRAVAQAGELLEEVVAAIRKVTGKPAN